MSKVCPECGGEMNREVRLVPYIYKNQTIQVEQPGEWCACGEAVLTHADVKATEKDLHDFRAHVDGLLTSVEVRQIRKKLKLTQKDAGDLFGGGPNAFSRYERGETTQMKAVDLLLRVFNRHPALLNEVKEQKLA